jgi:hypothetical protein
VRLHLCGSSYKLGVLRVEGQRALSERADVCLYYRYCTSGTTREHLQKTTKHYNTTSNRPHMPIAIKFSPYTLYSIVYCIPVTAYRYSRRVFTILHFTVQLEIRTRSQTNVRDEDRNSSWSQARQLALKMYCVSSCPSKNTSSVNLGREHASRALNDWARLALQFASCPCWATSRNANGTKSALLRHADRSTKGTTNCK